MHKLVILTIALICSAHFSLAQDFYTLDQIQNIEINFSQSNWDQLLDAEYSSTGDYILASSVTINGIKYDSVGVKYKGNSTYSPNQKKNPWHIELDTYKDQQYEAYTDIKLSNVAKDPSFLREVLSYQIIRQYMDAPLSNYAKVSVNGEYIGLYSNSESISKKFVDDRFGSKKNTFIKCNPPAGAGPQSNDYPNLVYLGLDSTDYYDSYELKSDAGWHELIDLCDTLENHTNHIDKALDVDRSLWMLALNNVLVNLDSYSGGFAQNYYLYRDDYGRFNPVIWDLNESFGRFSMTGSGNLNSNTAKQRMSHLLHEDDPDFPLISQLLDNPIYKRMYLAHMKTILKENFETSNYYDIGLDLQGLISDDVQEDDNKFFTYANFVSNLTTDINGGGGPGGGSTIGISNLMDARTDYLLGLSEFSSTEPTIENIALSESEPLIDSELSINATISNAEDVMLGYRNGFSGPFTRVAMYDDGQHNDGNAGDGIYGVELLISNTHTQYYIYAQNDVIGKFSPQRAEHEYHTITAKFSNTAIGDLVINEFMASNEETQVDPAEEFDDWIELYNNGASSIDLQGYFLSDKIDNLEKWTFPEGAEIASDGYLIIWADEDGEQEGLHANFKLSTSGESIFLSDPSGSIIDEVTFADQITDQSYGRFPNGTGDFQSMNPTFNDENIGTVSNGIVITEEFVIVASPNPFSNQITIEINSNQEEYKPLRIIDINSKVIHRAEINDRTVVNTSNWPAGVYFIFVNGTTKKILKID